MNGSFASKRPSSWLLILIAALLFPALYLVISRLVFRTGFPLDDAWIHQTYARNLALRGEWAFVPGQPSAGSTSPLWTVLLAPGYLFGAMPYVWTYGLGAACLGGLALAGERAYRALDPIPRPGWPFFGLFLAGEWHLVWAAVSGMETLLFALLILCTFLVIFSPRRRWWAGALIGAAVWVRPDGLTLLGPLFFVIFLERSAWREKARQAGLALAVFLLFFGPYLFFNRALAGSFWPNTFYAKQAEYAVMLQTPLLQRLGVLFRLPLTGAGVLFLPGLILLLVRAWRERRWPVLAAFLWWAGYTALYALRLPVSYQHGRYLIPSMPVYFLLGFSGTIWLAPLVQHALRPLLARALLRAGALSILLVWLIFGGMGAWAYAQDVAIIETEMVDTARWIAANLPPGDLLAVHDIGAVGYFAPRPIVDLAGLVTPDLIPVLRDEAALEHDLNQRNVRYLMTFPGWYPELNRSGTPVYRSEGKFAPANAGGENMVVYRWNRSP